MTETLISTLLVILLLLLIALAGSVIWMRFVTSQTIYEYQLGLRYRRGRLLGVVGPGRYTYLTGVDRLEIHDLRTALLQISGQDVLCADQVNIKLSLAVSYQITDPRLLAEQYADYQAFLYNLVQLKLREVVATMELDEVLAGRSRINEALTRILAEEPSLAGLTVQSAEIKDIILSSDLKKASADIIRAKKEGLAALERARGEMAGLRSLANAARMLEKNPELLQLRLIQTMERSQGNSFVLDPSLRPREKSGTPD